MHVTSVQKLVLKKKIIIKFNLYIKKFSEEKNTSLNE